MDDLDIIVKELTRLLEYADEEFPSDGNRVENILKAIEKYGVSQYVEGCTDTY